MSRDKVSHKANKYFEEDAPTVSVASNGIQGMSADSEPGVHPKHQPKKNRSISTKSVVMAMMRRAPMKNMVENAECASVSVSKRKDNFAGAAVFEVSSNLFYELKMSKRKGKHWRTYLNEDDCYQEIREYAMKNKKGAIIVQNENTGEMMYCRYC